MSTQIGYKGIQVDIIDFDKNAAKTLWDMLKQTWVELQNQEFNSSSKLQNRMLKKAFERKLNPTIFETITVKVVFRNISRVCLAQLTRHRGWIFNVESQMPQHVKHNILLPLNIANSKYAERAKELIRLTQELYDDMTVGNDTCETTNIPYQDARYLLLHGQTCDCAASFNLSQLMNVCKQRLENNTADEINYAFRKLLRNLQEAVLLSSDIDVATKRIYNYIIVACDAAGAEKHVGINYDDVFGNSFARFAPANFEVVQITKSCKSDFRKSAWYEELIRMFYEEHELLFPGEEVMVEKWLAQKYGCKRSTTEVEDVCDL